MTPDTTRSGGCRLPEREGGGRGREASRAPLGLGMSISETPKTVQNIKIDLGHRCGVDPRVFSIDMVVEFSGIFFLYTAALSCQQTIKFKFLFIFSTPVGAGGSVVQPPRAGDTLVTRGVLRAPASFPAHPRTGFEGFFSSSSFMCYIQIAGYDSFLFVSVTPLRSIRIDFIDGQWI